MAGDEQAIPILLGLGVDELSMAPARIPSAKQIIRNWSLFDARDLANKAINLESAQEVRSLVDTYTAQNH
jgi:phosphoenolpyruvate-protein kinase (PTS system EI component)